MKNQHDAKDLVPTELKVKVPAHVVRDLKKMEEHSKQSIDSMVAKAIAMFIATHRDLLPGSPAK